MERFGINAVFNSGAIKFNDKYILVARVEGNDRNLFLRLPKVKMELIILFFMEYPVVMPQTENPDTNIYDMRLVPMKMDGFMDYFVPNDETLQRLKEISQQRLHNVALRGPKIWSNGSAFLI